MIAKIVSNLLKKALTYEKNNDKIVNQFRKNGYKKNKKDYIKEGVGDTNETK